MPGFDRTGPAGKGSMTGGRRGKCMSASTQTNTPEQNGSAGRVFLRRGPSLGGGFGCGGGKNLQEEDRVDNY
ncbi:hypothetical protein UNSWDHB_3005 [Dehalobacter sp. UNSWDHB]|uniref:DUF5320 domain-containing protein n=1 Tax=Dehalobacter sp. UNSWDHB TaxID=1339256 RepID=UPI000387A43D|nr:DUF5320 domain-containing protein [Dehalobacter sp. UNSWDHB]EQB22691.1 hypothetical protein UNSWDHB_3005 [Dehalobacter sp. UNSWDHB]